MNSFNPSYIGKRNDILSLIPNSAKRVLDVGCSVGALAEQIKKRNNAEVAGIEYDEAMAKIAKDKLDKVLIADVETVNVSEHFAPNYFDCIIFADILEHLRNPWDVLKNLAPLLKDDGLVILSIPNVSHYSTIIQLLFRGYWPYRKRGIHDKTHLRFFTLKNIKQLLRYADLKAVTIKRIYRIFERPTKLNKFSKLLALPPTRRFLTFQYLICAKKLK